MGRRRRLPRILLNTATVVSFVSCVATVGLWGASWDRRLDYEFRKYTPDRELSYWFGAQNGNLGLHTLDKTPMSPHVGTRVDLHLKVFAVTRVDYQSGRQWFFYVHACALSMILATLPALRIWSKRPGTPGLCPVCGYDLRATPDRCPECGMVPSSDPPAT